MIVLATACAGVAPLLYCYIPAPRLHRLPDCVNRAPAPAPPPPPQVKDILAKAKDKAFVTHAPDTKSEFVQVCHGRHLPFLVHPAH